MRCHSWRALPSAHTPAHPPGECRRCWRPCRSRIPSGARCTDCTQALIRHPDPGIRRKALDCRLPAEAVIYLVSDLDLLVSLTAQEHLAANGIELTDENDPATICTEDDDEDQE